MIKQFIPLLIIFGLLDTVPCKPAINPPASITRDLIVELPGNEKINKRSIEDSMESDENDTEENSTSLNDDKSESSSEIASGSGEDDTASVPIFDTYPLQIPLRLTRSTDDNNDLQLKENSGVRQRVVRSFDDTNNENGDGMETAENGLVFRPLFRTKNNFAQRVARSIKEGNGESDDQMETAENGMVFRPLFRTKNNFGIKDRVRRNIDETERYVDDMETAANGLVFRPVFRTSNRYAVGPRSRRSDNHDLSVSPSVVNVVNSNDLHSRRNLRTSRSTNQEEFLPEKRRPNSLPTKIMY